MIFTQRKLSWSKRGSSSDTDQVVSDIQVKDFKKKDGHLCRMIVKDENGLHELSCRVNVNDITGKWTAHGINSSKMSVLCDIMFDN